MSLIPMRGSLWSVREDSFSYQTWTDLNRYLGMFIDNTSGTLTSKALLRDGSTPLSGNWQAGLYSISAGSFYTPIKSDTPGIANYGGDSYNLRATTSGSNLSFDMYDRVGALGWVSRLTIANQGNVGVGTVIPKKPLDICDTQNTGTYDALRLSNTTADTYTRHGIVTQHGDSTKPDVSFMYCYSKSDGSINNLGIGGGPASNTCATQIQLITAANGLTLGGATRMFINSGGFIGIGTTSPTTILHVKGSSPQVQIEATAGGSYLSTAGNFLDLNTNGYMTLTGGSYIAMRPSGVEVARFDNTGMGIGLTVAPSYLLHLVSDSAAKPSTNTWTVSSDQRLKENIVIADTSRCYDIVKSIPLKRYTWKQEVYTPDQVPDRSKLGWIANDVQTVFPKAVTTKQFIGVSGGMPDGNTLQLDDCLDLNGDQMYAAMYGALQYLMQKVERLEAQLNIIPS